MHELVSVIPNIVERNLETRHSYNEYVQSFLFIQYKFRKLSEKEQLNAICGQIICFVASLVDTV